MILKLFITALIPLVMSSFLCANVLFIPILRDMTLGLRSVESRCPSPPFDLGKIRCNNVCVASPEIPMLTAYKLLLGSLKVLFQIFFPCLSQSDVIESPSITIFTFFSSALFVFSITFLYSFSSHEGR